MCHRRFLPVVLCDLIGTDHMAAEWHGHRRRQRCRAARGPGARWRMAFGVCLARALVAAAGTAAPPGPEGECAAGAGDAVADGSCTAEEGASPPSCGCGALKRGDFTEAGGPAKGGAPPAEYSDAGETEAEAGVIYLDGGEFTMGISPSDKDDPTISPIDGEGPARQEAVGAFGLGRYEVSNARFAKFVEATKYVTEAESFGWSFGVEAFISEEVSATITQQVTNAPWWLPVQGADWRHPNGLDTSITEIMDHPVTQISLADAKAFCAWSRPGGRIPTEAEWEYAARGGRKRSRFPWGNSLLTGAKKDTHRMNIWQSDLDHRMVNKDGSVKNVYGYGEHSVELAKQYYALNNTAMDGFKATAPVTAFGPQNTWGFHNIVGNVWEWTSSQWVAAPDAPPVDPNTFVKKGGSFLCNAATCNRYRCSARMMFTVDSAASNVGFRCAYPGRLAAGSKRKAKDRTES